MKNEITPKKRGHITENQRLRRLLKEKDLMSMPLERLHPPTLATFRYRRLKDGVRASHYDLVLIRHAWNIAFIKWCWNLGENLAQKIRMLKNNSPREKRLRSGEYDRLKNASL